MKGISLAASQPTDDQLPTLPEVIERIGLGPAQLRAVLVGGGVWLADGSELLLISSVTQAVSDDWNLAPTERGLIVTIVFIGVLIGNLLCGPLGDTYGRRHILIASYTGIFFFSVLSSFSANLWTLCLARILVGMSFGFGQPAWNVLQNEITPATWRIPMMGFTMSLFSLGEIYSSILIIIDDESMEHNNWRWLLRMGAIPSLLFGIAAMIFLHQSPTYLALCGRQDDAMTVLESMSYDNSLPGDTPLSFRPAPPAATDGSTETVAWQFGAIFSRYMFASTTILMWTTFVLNVAYYGALYTFPQVLPKIGMSSLSAGMELLVGALWEILGAIMGCILGMCFARKPAMKLYLCLQTFSFVLFVVGATVGTRERDFGVQIMFYLGYFGIKVSVFIGCIIAYLYASEIYPTEMRMTGSAIILGCGRLGSTLAPLVFESLTQWTGTFGTFFYVIAALSAVNFLLIDFLPFETAGMLLTDRMSEVTGAKPDMSLAYGTATRHDET